MCRIKDFTRARVTRTIYNIGRKICRTEFSAEKSVQNRGEHFSRCAMKKTEKGGLRYTMVNKRPPLIIAIKKLYIPDFFVIPHMIAADRSYRSSSRVRRMMSAYSPRHLIISSPSEDLCCFITLSVSSRLQDGRSPGMVFFIELYAFPYSSARRQSPL